MLKFFVKCFICLWHLCERFCGGFCWEKKCIETPRNRSQSVLWSSHLDSILTHNICSSTFNITWLNVSLHEFIYIALFACFALITCSVFLHPPTPLPTHARPLFAALLHVALEGKISVCACARVCVLVYARVCSCVHACVCVCVRTCILVYAC